MASNPASSSSNGTGHGPQAEGAADVSGEAPNAKSKTAWEGEVRTEGEGKGHQAKPGRAAVSTGKCPNWQWEHRTGYRDFDKDASRRIEAHFQKGVWMMRMKTGKGHTERPREIYFYDMVQFDPHSGTVRNIRRVPEMHRIERFGRWVTTMITGFLRGEQKWWKPKALADFQEARRQVVEGDDDDWIPDLQDFESCSGRIVNSWSFGTLSVLMIVFNSIYIWIDADYNKGQGFRDTSWGFIFMDNLFCAWFFVELIVRFLAFKQKYNAFRDRWFVLDFVLVVLMVLETWILQMMAYPILEAQGDEQKPGRQPGRETRHIEKFNIFRATRLLRLARIARLFKIFPQLFVLMKGMLLAMRSLFYTLLLLFVLTFSFAIVFTYMTDYNPQLADMGYGSVGGSFWNLLIYGTFLDSVGEMLDGLKEVHLGLAFFFIVYIFISNLTMLNMLIGILCEVLARVSEEEQTAVDKKDLEETLTDFLQCYDKDDDQSLKRAEFENLLHDPDFQAILDDYSIDLDDLEKLKDVFFTQKGSLSDGTVTYSELKFRVLIDKVMQLRGGNTVTVNDMVELRGWLKRSFTELEGVVTPAAIIEQCKGEEESHPDMRSGDASASEQKMPAAASKGSALAADGLGFRPGFEEAVRGKLASIRAYQSSVDSEVSWLKHRIRELQENNTLLRG